MNHAAHQTTTPASPTLESPLEHHTVGVRRGPQKKKRQAAHTKSIPRRCLEDSSTLLRGEKHVSVAVAGVDAVETAETEVLRFRRLYALPLRQLSAVRRGVLVLVGLGLLQVLLLQRKQVLREVG